MCKSFLNQWDKTQVKILKCSNVHHRTGPARRSLNNTKLLVTWRWNLGGDPVSDWSYWNTENITLIKLWEYSNFLKRCPVSRPPFSWVARTGSVMRPHYKLDVPYLPLLKPYFTIIKASSPGLGHEIQLHEKYDTNKMFSKKSSLFYDAAVYIIALATSSRHL